ncbi:MAG: BMP family protein [Candidatus Pelethousia sp.]|nr:BMP family protein [Candidatus Pelethousia sp.]
MKKVLAILLLCTMLFSCFACSNNAVSTPPQNPEPTNPPSESGTQATPPAEAPKDYSHYRVVALLPGTITDNGWNYICYSAVKSISEIYGTQLEYIENIAVSDMGEYIRMYGEDKYDMVIVHGAQFESSVVELVPQYPDTKFCMSYGFKIDGSSDDKIRDIPNLAYVGPVGMGVAVGGIMGILTESNKVAFLGGQDIPAIADIVSGIAAGVALTNPDATATTAYIGTLTDQDMARELTNEFINKGYDVICSSANSAQLGCLWAAEEAGIYALGFNSDQYEIAPRAVVLSVMRNFSMIYQDVFDRFIKGEWRSGKVAYELSENGTIVSDWHGWNEKLPPEKVAAVDEFLRKLFAGEYDGKY